MGSAKSFAGCVRARAKRESTRVSDLTTVPSRSTQRGRMRSSDDSGGATTCDNRSPQRALLTERNSQRHSGAFYSKYDSKAERQQHTSAIRGPNLSTPGQIAMPRGRIAGVDFGRIQQSLETYKILAFCFAWSNWANEWNRWSSRDTAFIRGVAPMEVVSKDSRQPGRNLSSDSIQHRR